MKKLILGLSILSLSCQAGFSEIIKGASSSIAKLAKENCRAENVLPACSLAIGVGLFAFVLFAAVDNAFNHKRYADMEKNYIQTYKNYIEQLTQEKTLLFKQKQAIYNFYRSTKEFRYRIYKLNAKKHAEYINEGKQLIEQAETLLAKFDIDQIIHDAAPVYPVYREEDDSFPKEKVQKQNIVNEKPGYCYNCEDWFTKQDNHSPKTCGK